MKILKGKALIRKATTQNGDDVIILCGTFFPKNLTPPDSDEMWVCDMIINGGLKYTSSKNMEISPEDFLSGQGMDTKDWDEVEEL